MKVLWVCNVKNIDACKYTKEKAPVGGGWLTGLSETFKGNKNIELVYSYPKMNDTIQEDYYVEGIHYYSFYCVPKWKLLSKLGLPLIESEKKTEEQIRQCNHILNTEKPDIVHIFGTEFYHSLVFASLSNNKAKLVCSIQGLTCECSNHYLELIPYTEYRKINISTLMRGTLLMQKNEMCRRGENEKKCLRICENVIGRTDWDRICTFYIYKNRKYYKCNETLRKEFYDNQWSFNKCTPHTIFVSQASNPLKGFNIVIEAANLLKEDYDDLEIRVAGTDFLREDSIINKAKLSTYGKYIKRLIKKYGLVSKVKFMGVLNGEQMCQELLRCNVFVSSSSIENSPNSVGEAMVMGVPVISSNVGGVGSMLNDSKEGILYPASDYTVLAYRIGEMFDNKNYAERLGNSAKDRALVTHDSEKNFNDLCSIYNEIINNGNGVQKKHIGDDEK